MFDFNFNSIRQELNYFLLFRTPDFESAELKAVTKKIYEIANFIFDFLSNIYTYFQQSKTDCYAYSQALVSRISEKSAKKIDFTLKLPQELWRHIFSFLNSIDFRKAFGINKSVASDRFLQNDLSPCIAFGTGEWESYFGSVGIAPALPDSIHEILKSPCPFLPEKTVGETHVLVLIPETVNGKPLTLQLLEELICSNKSFGETAFKLDVLLNGPETITSSPAPKSHWVLMTKGLIPESLGRSYEEIEANILTLNQSTGLNYEIPQTLEVVTCSLMHFLRSQERILPKSPVPFGFYTFCQETLDNQERVIAGDFEATTYDICLDVMALPQHRGLSPLRRF